MAERPARLREAHAHVYAHGRAMRMVQLAGCRSALEMLDLIRDGVRAQRGAVLAHGARPEAWDPPGWPSLDQLDAVSGGAPVAAWCFDYHALVASTAALELAGFRSDTPDTPNGRIGRDDRGRLTGVLYESAAGIAWDALEPREVGIGDLTEAMIALHAAGFAEVHDLKSQVDLGSAMRGTGLNQATWVLYPLVEDLPRLIESRDEWSTDAIRLGGGKIFVDGTLNSRTAWMLHPFADGHAEHPSGMRLMSDAHIDDAIRQCAAHGLQLAAHAIGDAAVRAVLDATERVRPPRGAVRIEHAELIDAADVPRFADLGVLASVQPCHLLYDIEALRRACPDRLDRVLPLRELIDAGLAPGRELLFGSDTPIVRPDPEDSILAATRRARADMAATEAIAPAQAISEGEAWGCFDADA